MTPVPTKTIRVEHGNSYVNQLYEQITSGKFALVVVNKEAFLGLTDAQLRASGLNVLGPLTDAQMRAADVKITMDGEKSQIAPLTYLGGETLTPNNSSTVCTLPATTNKVYIAAEGGDIYYSINPGSNAASAASAGFIASSSHWLIGPLSTLSSLKVFAPAGTAKAHVEYFVE